jgi:hypothetical protein
MRLHKYKSYKQYVQIQSKKNKKTLDKTWATPEEMDAVADYVREQIPGATFGLCHGAKHGWESNELQQRLGCEVLGTDISPTAKKFDNVIRWDFHDVKDEWRGRTDFIYSNAWDHSYDPAMALDRWMECLQPQGLCFLEWSSYHDEENSTPDDPFGASLDEYREMIRKKYRILNEIEFAFNEGNQYPLERIILVVGHAEPGD